MPGPGSDKSGGESPTPRAFWTYLDAEGHQHIVDTLDVIPEKYRSVAEKIDLGKRLERGRQKATRVKREVGDVVHFVKDLHLPSVSVGFAGALAFILALTLLRRTGKLVFKLALTFGIFLFLGGAYLGWLREAAGLGSSTLSTPGEIIEDAEKAADKMRERIEETEGTLKKIEEKTR